MLLPQAQLRPEKAMVDAPQCSDLARMPCAVRPASLPLGFLR